MSQPDPRMDGAARLRRQEAHARAHGLRWRWIVALLFVSALIVAVVFLARADAAEPRPCRDGLVEAVDRGDVLVCSGLLVPVETWAAAQAAVDKVPSLEAAKLALEAQLVNLRGELAEARATGTALLQVCESTRAACEVSRMPPKCPRPPLFERPSFAWPVGIGLGFFGGFALSQWAVKE